MRGLVIDILFPNKYAKWRLVEIKSFIDRYDTDILVLSRFDYFSVDYEDLKESHSLEKYDILIFNPSHNYLNKHNSGFDGTIFNSKLPFYYLFRLKKYRGAPLNFSVYSFVYHIFLMCYSAFNSVIDYPQQKQFIHLYPGGALLTDSNVLSIRKGSNLVVSQHFITKYLLHYRLDNKYIEVFGGPFTDNNEIIKQKQINNGTLNVCFTSMWNGIFKGAHIYKEIIQMYKTSYPNDNITFYSIGLDYSIDNSVYLGTMSQKDLDKVYEEKMDIILSLNTTQSLNGFPLGVEGLIRGVVVFTPDHHGSNIGNRFNFGSELRIINLDSLKDIVDKIKLLYNDRKLLLSDSIKGQARALELFGYNNTMVKIFKFIEDNVK